MPDPDLVIRTSGETRISNFLLWEIAYSELVFPEVLWPDMRRRHLYEAVIEYQRRVSGFVAAVIDIPYDFTQRYYQRNRPRISFTEDNTDQFVSSSLLERVQQMVNELNTPDVEPRLASQVDLNVVEMYPYIEYIKYLLAGSIAMSIFIVAMIGGGITFIDDKARGLHEGYLVTPIQKDRTGAGI